MSTTRVSMLDEAGDRDAPLGSRPWAVWLARQAKLRRSEVERGTALLRDLLADFDKYEAWRVLGHATRHEAIVALGLEGHDTPAAGRVVDQHLLGEPRRGARPPRVTTDAHETMPLDMVAEADRYRVAEKKLWRIRSILETDLRVAADYLDEIERHEAWRAFKCASMADFVEQRLPRLDEAIVDAIRRRLSPPASVPTDEETDKLLADAARVSEEAGVEIARLRQELDAEHREPAPALPRVVNLHRDELGDAVYVGRASPRRGLPESPFGNPYKEGRDGTRDEVIEKYRSWLLARPDLLDRLRDLRGRRLACWCKPAACHGDALAALVDADEVLDDVGAAGAAVEAVDGRLRLSPPSAVDAALRARVAAHKPGILALLKSRRPAARDRRGDHETPEEARSRQAAAVERLRLDRQAFVEEARRAGVYRDLAAGSGESVP